MATVEYLENSLELKCDCGYFTEPIFPKDSRVVTCESCGKQFTLPDAHPVKECDD